MAIKKKINRNYILLTVLLLIGCTNISNKSSDIKKEYPPPLEKNLLRDLFNQANPQIEIIGEYTGLTIKKNGKSFQDAKLTEKDNIRILKDKLYSGYLVAKSEDGTLKSDCSVRTTNFIYNKRALFIFNEAFSSVCVIYQSFYNEKKEIIETPYTVFSLDDNCFEIIQKGTFDGEEIKPKAVRRLLER